MRTILSLSLLVLTSTLTLGCSFEYEELPPLSLGQDHSPETLAVMIYDRDLAGMREALSAGVDPNLAGPSSLPPLHLAASLGFIEEGRLLLERGANIDKIYVTPTVDADGDTVWQPMTTPLHIATQYGHVDFVLMLVDQNVNVNVPNARESTALDIANVLADQLEQRAERLSESLKQERVLEHGRSGPLREMIEQAEVQIERVASVARLLEHHGAKTKLDLQGERLLAEIDADGTLHNIPERIRRWKLGRKTFGRDVASSDESVDAPSSPAAESTSEHAAAKP